MTRQFIADQIEVVIKITKYCNLRCGYCYEYPELGNKHRMSLMQIHKLLDNFSSFTTTSNDDNDLYSFIWHGGEPFMVEMAYYEQIGEIQENVIGDRFRYHNSVQTNLTILTPEHLDALAERRFFHAVGFSFDVYGEDRRNSQGKNSSEKVLKNLQLLLNRQISAGAICVLSRATLPHIISIFKYYDNLGINLRILPFHIETITGQSEAHGLSPKEIATGMNDTFDHWLSSERPIKLYPLDIYLKNALNFMNGFKPYFYDQETDESIFVVNVNGDVSGYESYLGDAPYGNIFEQDFEQIIYSKNRKKYADAAAQRVERFCSSCPYYGACSGYPAASANSLEIQWFLANECYVAIVISHIVHRIEESGISIAHPDMAAYNNAQQYI